MKDLLQPPANATQPPPGRTDPPAFDFRKYFYMIVRRLWLLVLCFFVSVSVMLVMMMRQQPEYTATTKVQLVRSLLSIPSNLRQADMEAILGDYAQTQRAVILSTNVINLAKSKLELTPQEFGSKHGSVAIAPGRQTAILNISVTSLDPHFCADYANAIAEAFVEYKRAERSNSSQDTAQNLSNQAQNLANQIEKMEDELLAFVRENSVLGIKERGNQAAALFAQLASQSAEYHTQRRLLETQQPLLSEASPEIVLATLDYGLSSQTLAAPAAGETGTAGTPEGGDLADNVERLIDHGLVQPPNWEKLKRENALLEAQLVSYRKKWLDDHPYIQQTLEKLRANEEAMDVETQFALKQYRAKLDALTIKEKAAKRVEGEWEEEALEIERKKTEYEGLQRKLDRAQRLYDLILNRLQEVDISAGIQLESVRILERALVPGSMNNPRNLQGLFLAAIIGIGIGIALIVLLDFMDDSFHVPEEAVKALDIPFLGLVPTAHWKRDGDEAYWVGRVDPSSGFAEAYRNIRSVLMLNPGDPPPRVFSVISSVPKEGKTTTCANLGTSFAQTGRRILLVDMDLHRGSLHHLFGLQAGVGISDVLTGKATMEGVVQHTSVPGLDLVATGTFPENPAELILRPAMQQFLQEATEKYDLVFMDAPPVLAVSESTVVAALSDAVIMVIHGGRTSRKLARMSLRQLLARGANMAGLVINNLDMLHAAHYGYSSYYSPYYTYDYRYEEEEEPPAPGNRKA